MDSKSSGHTDFSLLRIKGELEAAEKLAEMRLKDLETCEKARVEILIEKESLERRIADLPMEYLNNSSDIQSMQKEYTRLRKEVDDLKRSAEVISTRWEEQDAHLKDNLQKAELTMENRRREFLSTLDSIQSEASRLRKERDNMREAYERANSLVTANVRANGELQKNLEEVRSQVNVWKAKALRIKTLEEILTMLSNSEISIDSRSKEALDAIREIKEQESLIYGEIESLEKVFEGAQYTVERLTKQLSEKEEQISRLLGEKLRADFVVVQCKKDADIATQNATLLEKHALAQIEEFDKKNAEMRKKIEILESRLSQKTLEVEKLQHRMSEMRGEISQVQEKLKGISSKDHEKIIAEKTKISEAILFEKKRLEEEIERLRHQMRVVGLSSSPRTNNATFGAEKELQIYKKLMKCNSCHLRDKNAVITKCMHVFCKQCLDTRIETRQRKCPNCGEAFGTSDVRMIYL